VRIVQVSVEGQAFSVSGVGDLPITVSAGATYNLNIGFSPTGPGTLAGQLTIVSNSVSNGTMVIALNGTGAISDPSVALSTLSCANSSLTGAGADNCTVTLNGTATSVGFVVSMTSNNSAVTVPTSVTVPAGASSASFTATAVAVTSAQSVTLTASAGGVVETFALQLNAQGGGTPNEPTLEGLTCASNSMAGSGNDSCTVFLNVAAGSGGFVIGLASNNNAVVVPPTLTVPAGATSAEFSAAVSAVSLTQTATLTASAGGVMQSFALQLAGSGPVLAINSTSLEFGNVNLNTVATQTLTLSSSGSLPVTVTAAIVAGSGFSVSGGVLPLSLSGGQTAALNVEFNPIVTGPATGTLTIVSTSLTNPVTVINLSGKGVAASYEVDLTWDAPTISPDPVVGYIVFRSPSGTALFAPINVAVVTQTRFIDTSVKSGQSYDYLVESVDAAGIESAPSNTATAVIP